MFNWLDYVFLMDYDISVCVNTYEVWSVNLHWKQCFIEEKNKEIVTKKSLHFPISYSFPLFSLNFKMELQN